jgi:hypothetical protein
LKKKEADYDEVSQRYHEYQERTVEGLKQQDLLQAKLNNIKGETDEINEENDKMKKKL